MIAKSTISAIWAYVTFFCPPPHIYCYQRNLKKMKSVQNGFLSFPVHQLNFKLAIFGEISWAVIVLRESGKEGPFISYWSHFISQELFSYSAVECILRQLSDTLLRYLTPLILLWNKKENANRLPSLPKITTSCKKDNNI